MWARGHGDHSNERGGERGQIEDLLAGGKEQGVGGIKDSTWVLWSGTWEAGGENWSMASGSAGDVQENLLWTGKEDFTEDYCNREEAGLTPVRQGSCGF